MHYELEEMQRKVFDCMRATVEECGLDSVSIEAMGQFTDMMKDLSEARYYDAVTDAMAVPDPERMGYDNWRYASGRYAPKGRGEYRPGYTETPGRYNADNGDQRYPGAYSSGNGRMGYPMGPTSVGRSYDEFRDRRKSYTEAPNAENRRMMEESAQRHVDEAVDSFRDMWNDVDQPTRLKMKESLTRLVNEMA